MRLKDYQIAALDTLSAYLKILRAEYDSRATNWRRSKRYPSRHDRAWGSLGDPVTDAWKEAQNAGQAASPGPWHAIKDGAGRSVPHVCLKLPTGGGKTLLAAHGVDRILVSHFRQPPASCCGSCRRRRSTRRQGRNLPTGGHPICQTLDRLSGGRVKILEKLDGFTRGDIDQKLCVLLLMLQSTGRENKETLKVFRDSGNYTSFFPQDDPPARAALLNRSPISNRPTSSKPRSAARAPLGSSRASAIRCASSGPSSYSTRAIAPIPRWHGTRWRASTTLSWNSRPRPTRALEHPRQRFGPRAQGRGDDQAADPA